MKGGIHRLRRMVQKGRGAAREIFCQPGMKSSQEMTERSTHACPEHGKISKPSESPSYHARLAWDGGKCRCRIDKSRKKFRGKSSIVRHIISDSTNHGYVLPPNNIIIKDKQYTIQYCTTRQSPRTAPFYADTSRSMDGVGTAKYGAGRSGGFGDTCVIHRDICDVDCQDGQRLQ